MINNDTVITTLNFTGNRIWFRSSVTQRNFIASFGYSENGKIYHAIGNNLHMGLGLDWTANRFALFNYNTKSGGEGGFVDFNWFHFNDIKSIPPP